MNLKQLSESFNSRKAVFSRGFKERKINYTFFFLKEKNVANADIPAIKAAMKAKFDEPVLTVLLLAFVLLSLFVLVCEF